MGNVTLAVPDLETDVLRNPAHLVEFSGLTVFAHPSFFSNSADSRRTLSSTGTPSNSTLDRETSAETGIDAPIHLFLAAGPASVGGSFTYQRDVYKNASEYDYTTPGSRSYTKDESEFTTPAMIYSVRAAFDFDPVALGMEYSANSSDGTLIARSRWENPDNVTTGEEEYADRFRGRNGTVGLTFGTPGVSQLSAAGSYGRGELESKQTRHTINGVPNDLSEPNITKNTSHRTEIIAEWRGSLGAGLAVGLRADRLTFVQDDLYKGHWSTTTGSSVYQERKQATHDETENELLAGLSASLGSRGLVAAEYGYRWLDFETTNYILSSGSGAAGQSVGDIESETTKKGHRQVLRLGGEFAVAEWMTLRLGSEVSWSVYVLESKDRINSSVLEHTGNTDATYESSGGFSVTLPPFRIDYALSYSPVLRYSWVYAPPYEYSFRVIPYTAVQWDAIFQHHLALRYHI